MLEERVVEIYRRLGYFMVKRSVMVKDHFGNLSEIDVRAGVFVRRYVECKNYSATHAVPFSDVAKFKSVLELNDIPITKYATTLQPNGRETFASLFLPLCERLDQPLVF